MSDLRITRRVHKGHNGLPVTLEVGDTVYRFHGATYGCLTKSEVPVSLNGSYEGPFYGIPRSAIQ